MNEDPTKLLGGMTSTTGANSRRLAATVVGVVMLVWLVVAWKTATMPEIPVSVLVLVAIVVGTQRL